MEAKAPPGTPWEGEISLGNFSGGPPEDSNKFLFRPRGAMRAFWEPPGEAPGAHLAPNRAPEPSRSHFGTQNGAKIKPPGLILGVFLTPPSSVLVSCALRSFTPRVYVRAWRARLDVRLTGCKKGRRMREAIK